MMLVNDAQPAVQPERLTWDEICKRYPDEWVVIADMDWVEDGCFEFGTAIVLAHHKARKAATPDVKEGYKHFSQVGAYFTGRLVPPPYELRVP
jgi:hypothetical protein